MIIGTIKGDLLQLFKENNFDAIAHGANCFHTMGGGIAGQIAKQFPEAYEADLLWEEKGHWCKLGYFSSTKTQYGDIHNFYTQYLPGPNFEYTALIQALTVLEDMIAKYSNLEFYVLGVPMIGAGIGGGNWEIIKEILDATKLHIIVVEYDKGEINMGQTKIDFTS